MSLNSPSILSILGMHRDPAATFAIGAKRARSWNDFRQDVGALVPRITEFAGSKWLVACEDAYELAIALISVMQANCQAVLPAHFQSGHLDELAVRVDGVVASAGVNVTGARVLRVPVESTSDTTTEFRPLDSTTAEIVLYTSGTTGAPLPVRKPLRCFESEIEVLEKVFAPPSNAVILATVPAHHIYGLLFRVLWPIATKRTFSSTVIRFPDNLTAALDAGGRQIVVSSPAFLKRALPVLDLGRLSSSCCQIFSSGGPLPPEVAARYNSVLKEPIREVYGSTETGGIAYRSVFSADNPEPWTPFPGVKLSLDNESGVLKVQSPNLPDQNSVSTGDKVRMLAESRFVLTGRADRIVKIEQQRISLSDLERRLTELPEVNRARVLIRNFGEGRRDTLAAVIEPSPQGWSRLLEFGKRQMREHLCASLRLQVSTLALPRKWRFLRRIPENARGKTLLSSLEALWEPSTHRPIKPEIFAREEGQYSLTLKLRPPVDLLFFDGHFDLQPVLAGVAQLSWVVDIAQRQFEINDAVRQISALKFHNVIRPNQEIELTLSFDRNRNRVRFQFSRTGKKLSSGSLLFGNAS